MNTHLEIRRPVFSKFLKAKSEKNNLSGDDTE